MVIIMKKSLKILSLILCVVLCFSCFSVFSFAQGDREVLLGDINGDGEVTTEDAQLALKMAADIIKDDLKADMNGDGIVSVTDAVKVLFEAVNIGGIVIPDKNGENFLSDDPNNEFIKLIASTYNLNPKSLVAIYSEPDSGTNYVLEFNKVLLSNEYNKSANGLKKVYHIGLAPERKISYTDGSLTEGESHHYNCTAAEGWLTFNLVKKDVMAQYPDYFK